MDIRAAGRRLAAMADVWLGGARRGGGVPSKLWPRSGMSLPSRITVLVFASTLLTSLTVTWISIQSNHAFLSKKVNEKFPEILARTHERLDLWYSQRRLDIDTFSHSETVVENLPALREKRPGARAKVARDEVERYLSYVLERFEQYESLFALDPDGQVLLWVGTEAGFPDRFRRRLAGISESNVSDIFPYRERRFQVASAPVRGGKGAAVGSLHALLRLDSLESLLKSDDLGPLGEIFLIGADGSYLTHTRDRSMGEPYGGTPPADGDPVVENYANDAGEQVVGSSLLFKRFGWAIVVEESYEAAFAPVVRVIWRVLGFNLAIVLLFGLIALQIATSIVRPIKALCEGASRVTEGETEVVVLESSSTGEIGLLTRTFNKMTARLHRNRLELQQSRLEIEAANSRLRAQNEELQRVNEQLEKLSITDELTKLYNHRYFQEQLSREIKRAKRTGDPLALILIDIDNFKRFNDKHGHAAGDEVLRQVAAIMSGVVRETDLLARYGGEEFALLATQASLAGAVELAEKIRLAVSEGTFFTEGLKRPKKLRITVSVGVARFRGDRQAFFNDADRALYRAKAGGKDCVMADEGD